MAYSYGGMARRSWRARGSVVAPRRIFRPRRGRKIRLLHRLACAAVAAFLSAAPAAFAQTAEPGLDISEIAFRAHEPARGQLSEGSSATYTVALKSDPGGTVTVTPSSSHIGSLAVSPPSLSFDGNNWASPRTVTLTALEDDNIVNEKVTVSHAVSGYGSLTSGPDVKLSLFDISLPVTADLVLRLTGKGAFKEGGTGRVEVELRGPSGYSDRLPATPFRVCYELGTLAAADLDTTGHVYSGASGNCRDLYIAESGGQRSTAALFGLFDVRSDRLDETRETFTVTLMADPDNPTHGRVGISTTEDERTFNVPDSSPTNLLRIDVDVPDSIREGSGEVTFDLVLDFPSNRGGLTADEEVRVPLDVSGEGVDADDYSIVLVEGVHSQYASLSAEAPYTLTFATGGVNFSGDPQARLTLSAIEDGEDEVTETLTLSFSGVTSNLDTQDPATFDATGVEVTRQVDGRVIRAETSLSVDIIDGVVVSVSAGDGVTEGGDAVFTVTALPKPREPLDVSLGIAQTGAFVAAAELGASKTVTIPVTGSVDYTVATLDDEVDETDGAVTATLAAGNGYRIAADAGSASVAVADDEATTVHLSAPASVGEGSPVAVTATLSLAQSGDVKIPISAGTGQDDSAEAIDFSAPESIDIEAGATTGSADVVTARDADKDDESFTVALGDTLPSGIGAGDPDEVEIGITDDGKDATVSLSATATTVKDKDDAGIEAVLSHVFDAEVTVPISVAGSGANPAEAGEWDAPAGISIAAGATGAGVAIDLVRDQDKDDETFTVSLGNTLPANLSPGTTTAVEITIDDDGKGHDISLSASPNPVEEGKSTTITASANGLFDADTTIPLSFKGHGTGKAEDGDWEAPGQVVIKAGATSGTATLDALGDRDEDDETVRVSLGTPLPAGVVGGDTHDIAITDTGVSVDSTLTLSIDPAPNARGYVTVAEGASVTLTATLDTALSADLTLGIELGDEFDTADEDDYSELSGITIAAGKTSASAGIAALADGEYESGRSEEFTLVVLATNLPDTVLYKSYDRHTDGEDDRYSVRIEDRDQPRPTISVTRPSSSRGVTEGGQARISFSAAGRFPSGGLDVKFKVEQDGDFLPAGNSGDQTFSMTSRSGDHSIATQGDTKDEANGTMTVTLLEDPAYRIDAAGSSVTLPVLDDDPTEVSLTGSSADINENGGSKTLTISLSRALSSGEVLVVVLDHRSSGAQFGADFIMALDAAAPGVGYSARNVDFGKLVPAVTFTGGAGASRSAVLKLTAVDDKASEGPESASVSLKTISSANLLEDLGSTSGTGLGGGAEQHASNNAVTFGIVDNDSASVGNVTVAPTSLTLTEGEKGTYFVVFDKEIIANSENFRTEFIVTPSSPDDSVTFSPQQLKFRLFRGWNRPQKITVTAVDDGALNQSPRSATISHAVANYPGVTTAPSVTVTVRDAGGLGVSPAALSVPVTDKRRLDIKLVSKPDSNVVVNLASSAAGTASLSKTSLTFTAANWNIAQVVEVTGVKAGKAEIAVSVDTAGTKDDRYIGKRVAVPVTVAQAVDARPTVSLSAAANSVAEGGALRLTARLSAALAPPAAVTIPLAWTNGTAEDADYAKVASITIASGKREGTADFTSADNAIHEGDETVTIAFGTLPGTVRPGAVTEQTVTITDEADLPTLAFLDAARTVDEDAGKLTVSLVWLGESELDASLDWETADGTATAGEDYAQASGTITRKAGATGNTATIEVEVTDDTADDPGAPETFTVALSNAVGARAGTRAVHTVSITDDEPTEVRLIADSDDMGEASGTKTIEVRVVRDLVAGETLPVPLSFTGAAAFGVDYTVAAPGTKPKGVTYANLASTDLAKDPPTLTFTGGDGHARIATLVLTAIQDDAEEEEEDVTVTLGALDAGTGLDGGAKARAGEDSQTFAITDDDLPTLGIAAGGAVGEGGRAGFTVTSDVTPLADLPVKLSASQQGDFVDARYLTASATIAKGAKTATFEIITQNDRIDEPDGSVTVTIEDGAGAYTIKSGAGSASVPVTDRDPTTVSLSAGASTTLVEGDATSKVSLTLQLGRDLVVGEVAEIPLSITSATGVAITGTGAANRDYVLTATGTGVTLSGAGTAAPKIKLTGAGGTERSAVVELTATARDDGDEEHETLTVALGNLADSGLATTLSGGLEAETDNDPNTDDNQVELEITDDEGLKPLLNLATADGKSAPAEGSPAEYKLTLDPAPSTPLEVEVTVAEEGGLDYVAPAEEGGRTLTVPANQSVFNFTVPTKGNDRDENRGGVVVTLVADVAYRIGTGGAHTIAVHDDETTGLTMTRSDRSPDPLYEDGGVATIEFTLARALGAGDALTIPLTVRGATLPTHATLAVKSGRTGVKLLTTAPWSAAQPALELSGAGVTGGVIEVTAVDNADRVKRALKIGPDSSAVVAAGPGLDGGVDFAGKAIDIVIVDNDGPPQVFVETREVAVHEGGSALFSLRVDPAPRQVLPVKLDVRQRGDFIHQVGVIGVRGHSFGSNILTSAGTLSLTVPAKYTAPVLIAVDTSDDSVDEPNGLISIREQKAGAAASVVEVWDNDGGRTLALSRAERPFPIGEGGTARFTLTLSALGGSPLAGVPQVNLRVSQVGDFVADPKALGVKQFPFLNEHGARVSTLVYEVPTVNDDKDERNGKIIVELLPCSKTQGRSTCAIAYPPNDARTIVVQDDDPDVAMVNVQGRPLSLSESKLDTGGYEVSLQTDPGQGATVTVSVEVPEAHRDTVSVKAPGGTAGSSATLGFTGGPSGNWATPQTVTVAALEDDDGADETIVLAHAVTGYPGVTSAPDFSVDVADIGYKVVVEPDDLSVHENGGTATYRLRLASKPTAEVTVTPVSADKAKATVSGPLTFAPGNWKGYQTVTVTGVQQGKARVDHRTASTDTNYQGLPERRSSVDVAVVADTRPVATLTAAPNPVAEGADLTLTATLDKAVSPAGAITIPLTWSYGTASSADIAEVASITIASGETSGSATVSTVDDTEYEKTDETFSVAFGTLPEEVRPGSASVDLAIDDAGDVPRVATIAASSKTVAEGGEVTVTVTLDKALDAPARAVTIPLAYTLGDTEEADLTQLAGVTIAEGGTVGTGKIAIVDDAVHEPEETFTVALGATLPVGVSAGETSTVEVAIAKDATDLPSVGFDPEQTRLVGNEHYVDVVEGVGTLKLTVVRTGESELPASGTVTYTGTQAAQEGSVYEATTKKWTLAAGDTSVSIPVKILDDEDDPVPVRRTFTVRITPVSGERAGNILSVVVNVLDDDPTPVTLTPGSDVSLGEGDDENAGTATLTLARYLAGGEVLGEVVEVPLVLTTSTGAELPGSGTPDFTLSLAGVSAESGDAVLSGGNTATPKVKFTGSSIRVVRSVDLAFAATARDDGDFSDETFKVALGDFSDEKLATMAHGGAVASAADNIATFTIVDDDEEPAGFVLSVDAGTVAEDVSKAPTITVTAAPISGTAFTEEHDIAVTVGASGDTAAAPDDYAAVSGFTITVPANGTSASGSFVLTPVDDALDEADEVLTVTGVSGDLDVRPATITLTDDDDLPTVSVDDAAAVGEGDDPAVTADMTFAVALSAASGRTVTVPYSLSGSATAGDDYAEPDPLSLEIAAGATSANIVVPIKGDATDEPDETVEVTLGTPTHATVSTVAGAGTASGSVADDDATTVTLATPDVTADEGDGTDTARIALTLGRGLRAGERLAVPLAFAGGAARTDFTLALQGTPKGVGLSGTTVTFTGPETGATAASAAVLLTAAQDDDAADDTVTVSIPSSSSGQGAVLAATGLGGGATGTRTGTGRITLKDDDTAGLVFAPAKLSVAEGGTATYTVALATRPSAPVTVTVGGGSGKVTADTDAGRDGDQATLSFTTTNWATPRTVTVAGTADGDLADEDVTLTHTASGGDYGSVTGNLAVKVTDDDVPEVSIAAKTASVAEGTAAVFTVTAAPAPATGETLTVSLAVADAPNADFVASGNEGSGKTVTVDDTGTVEYSVATVGTNAETADEPDGDVTVTVAASTAYTVSASAGAASVRVTDDDATAVVLAVTDATADEGDGNDTARLTLTLGRGLRVGERLAVPLAFAGGAAGTDFTLALQGTPAGVTLTGTTVTFTGPETGATAASAAVLLTSAQDDDAADDTVTVSIPSSSTGNGAVLAATGLGGGATGTRTGTGRVTLKDDDTAGLVFAPAKLTVAEGGTATYTVRLATRPSAPVTVTVRSDDAGAATADTDADTGGDQSTLSFTTTNWATPQEVTVAGTADGDLADEDVTLTHTASGGDYGSVAADLGVKVTDGDEPTVTVAGGAAVTEGTAARFTVSAAPAPLADLTVTLSVSDAPGSDFVASGNEGAGKTVTIAANAASATYEVATQGGGAETADEPDGPVTVTVADGTGYAPGAPASAAVTVRDDDATTVTLATPDATADEGDGKDTARITLTLGRGLRAGERLAVPLAFAGGAAETDFTLALQGTPVGVSLSGSGTTVTFTGPKTGATAASAAVLLTAAQDDDAADDTVTVSIPAASTGAGAVLAATGLGGGATGTRTGTGRITLKDDDTAGLVFAPAKLSVAEGGTATYTVRLATRPSAPVTVTVGGGSGKVTADTDAGRDGDQVTLSFTTTDWATPRTVTVAGTADGDLADEDVTLTHTASGGGYGSVTGTLAVKVTDGDEPTVTVAGGGAVTEGTAARFTVSADPAPLADLTVTLSVSDAPGADFVASGNEGAGKTVTIAANTASATYEVATQGGGAETADEPDGPVTVTVADGTGYAPGDPASAAVTVRDDDATTVTLATPDATADEGDGKDTARITLTLGRGLRAGERLAVPLAFAGGAAGTDFTLALQGTPVGVSLSGSGTTVTFTGPETGATAASAAVLLTAAQDDDAADGTVTVSIPSSSSGQGAVLAATGLGGGATGSRDGTGTITLEDDDTAALVFAPAKLSVAEGGTATYTVRLATRPSATVTVTVTAPSGLLVDGPDAGTATETLTFTAANWDETQTVTVTAADDDIANAGGVRTAELSHDVSGGGYHAQDFTVEVQVRDDDVPTVTVAAGAAVTEGGDAVFTLTADPAPAAALAVGVTVVAAGEYGVAAGAHTVTIPTTGSATLTLATAMDHAKEADGSVTATVNAGGGYVVGASGSATVAVKDDDALSAALLPLAQCASSLPGNAVSVSEVKGWRNDHRRQGSVELANLWDRVLAALHPSAGAGVPMSASEAQTYAKQGWIRWRRAAATLRAIERCLPEISIAPGPYVFEGRAATFKLTATRALPASVKVNMIVTEDPRSDVVASDNEGARTVVFPAGETEIGFAVATVNDRVNDPGGGVVTVKLVSSVS